MGKMCLPELSFSQNHSDIYTSQKTRETMEIMKNTLKLLMNAAQRLMIKL